MEGVFLVRIGSVFHPAAWAAMYNASMAKRVIHVTEAEAASDFAALLARVRAGAI